MDKLLDRFKKDGVRADNIGELAAMVYFEVTKAKKMPVDKQKAEVTRLMHWVIENTDAGVNDEAIDAIATSLVPSVVEALFSPVLFRCGCFS